MRRSKPFFVFSVSPLILSMCLLFITGCVDKRQVNLKTPQPISELSTPSEVGSYYKQITEAISRELHDADLYKGRTCSLRIRILRDGTLADVRASDGDPELCQAAIIAIKKAKIPKPPSEEIYQVFKDASVLFII